MRNPIVAKLTAVAALALLLTSCTSAPRGGADLLPGPIPTDASFAPAPSAPPAPQFTGELLDGSSVDAADLWDGRPLILQFMTGWCTQCVEQAKDLDAVADEYGDAVSIVYVSGDDKIDSLTKFLNDNNVVFPVVDDTKLQVWRSYAVVEPPMTALIDAEGGLVRMWPGGASKAQLDDDLTKLVTLGG
ncbi:TlpA family protein disulfide reductase [Compostimonas suwonensis]|uniref:Peroxiredoxin n=1 Tax=Compostimonas suwonensis TaxID=1048394 RepID=A0A2M9BZ27_9MICO|nr:TlpA disulfide reductase family protein [Compostimonas suwonensis]PJJ63332.1 peroxiredoxin [Compostimonas suwonensis]